MFTKGNMMERKPISVSLLANYIKQIFDAEMLLYNIDVIGEISSWNSSNGNVFFVIKDENAILNCVFFGNSHDDFKVGDKVIVTGTPKYYVKGGKLNFNAVDIRLYGEGELYKRFMELKLRLEKEGLFDVSHKKAMPKTINRIGVVTSETGAVIHDILNVSKRRNSAQDIVLYPIKVQGIGAEIEIAKGINFFSNYDNVDAIIVGRGGGSDEDLSNFNTEIVARAIFDCKKFVVSAVGHETDFTICDFVADLRAPTPSAAAELLTKDGAARKENLKLLTKTISSLIDNKIFAKKSELAQINTIIDTTMQTYFVNKKNQIDIIIEKINSLNPKKILDMGYAKIESNGQMIDSVKNLSLNQEICVNFADGKAIATIKEIE